MISLDNYDEEKMKQIEESLLMAFYSQHKIRNIEKYFEMYAPAEFMAYCKDYEEARKRLREEGIVA